MLLSEFSIQGRSIGPNHPPYVIAEVSANHNGDIQRALDTISAAKDCGADAVKIQTYTPDTITIQCDKPDFRIKGGLWGGQTLYELYQQAYTPYEWHPILFDHARSLDITLFSSPFDLTAVNLLETLETPAYKIASFELIDKPLVEAAAATGKPIIMSTGMANADEIQEAVCWVRAIQARDPVLLHCVSGYPSPPEDYCLRTIPDMAQRFNTLVGLSDHTLGIAVAVASVALGACIIEKHFTLSRQDEGPDSAFSLEPHEFQSLCHNVKTAWSSLGDASYHVKSAESANKIFRRSLYAVRDIAAGEVLSLENVRSIRPGSGLPPKYLEQLVGQTAVKPIERGTAIQWDLVALNGETTSAAGLVSSN
jgi:pseudaminic acid synthase